jgi:hypothetical protein
LEESENVSLLNKKMLLAPVLAIALAFLLVGATSYFPQSRQAMQSSPSPQPTGAPFPIPSAAPSTAPTPSIVPQTATGESSILLPVLSVVAAIVVAIIAVLLLFSERDLKLER